jgi:plasmid maintenance system antidote protein VapI
MGRPEAVIGDLIAGQAALTEEMAEQLAHLLGVPAHFWRNGEMRYRTLHAQQTGVTPS